MTKNLRNDSTLQTGLTACGIHARKLKKIAINSLCSSLNLKKLSIVNEQNSSAVARFIFMQIENICNVKLLGLAGGNTKKRENKKSGDNITPRNPLQRHSHVFSCSFPRYLVVFQGQS